MPRHYPAELRRQTCERMLAGEAVKDLDQRADRRAFQPNDEVPFPVPRDGTIGGLGGSLTDHHFRGDVAPGLLL